jgi:hypothetical protein
VLTFEVAAVVSWHRRAELNKVATQRATGVLIEEGLLKPWERIALVGHLP